MPLIGSNFRPVLMERKSLLVIVGNDFLQRGPVKGVGLMNACNQLGYIRSTVLIQRDADFFGSSRISGG